MKVAGWKFKKIINRPLKNNIAVTLLVYVFSFLKLQYMFDFDILQLGNIN